MSRVPIRRRCARQTGGRKKEGPCSTSDDPNFRSFIAAAATEGFSKSSPSPPPRSAPPSKMVPGAVFLAAALILATAAITDGLDDLAATVEFCRRPAALGDSDTGKVARWQNLQRSGAIVLQARRAKHIQRSAKKYANLAKQDPGRGRQNT